MADALAAGKVDAVLIWEPIIYEVIKKIDSQAITWPAQGGQDFYWLLVGREEVIKKKPAAIEKLLLALRQAAEFMKQQPGEAQDDHGPMAAGSPGRLQAGKYPIKV